jgi:hypothetical protein
MQLLADSKIEANFPGASKTLILLGASLPASFLFPTSYFIAELLSRKGNQRFPLVKHKMHDHTP